MNDDDDNGEKWQWRNERNVMTLMTNDDDDMIMKMKNDKENNDKWMK